MAHLSRIVIPDLPHHVTQRGNRRQALFVEPADCELYRDLLAERWSRQRLVVLGLSRFRRLDQRIAGVIRSSH
jgi:putative transposase